MMMMTSDNTIGGTGVTTERAVAGVVIGSLLILILIRRGFRGVGVSGIGSIKMG